MSRKESAEKEIKFKRFRLGLVGFFMVCAAVSVIARLYYIQINQHERYASYSKSQYFQTVQLNQTRGKILDKNGTPLALTIPMRSVFAHPLQIENREKTAGVLAEELGLDADSVLKLISKKKNFVWVQRKITDEQYASLKEKDLKGVSFLEEDKRFYPYKNIGARVIGFCGIDNQGLAGIEYEYEKLLAGEKALFVANKDALGRVYGYADGRDPNDRFEVVTTIDVRIQQAAEKVVREAFEEYQAKAAIAIVMSAKSGEILAMAEQPEFNPNNFADYPTSSFKSLSVTQSYEPGSTFKVFLAAAALDSGVAKPEDKFDCGNGSIKVGENVISEAMGHSFGELSFSDVIVKSSNIGSIKIARLLGERRFYHYIRKFGFGSRTEVDLPGETSGLLQDYREWSSLSLPSISFGQEITATPIQLVSALSVIGNGGMYVKPHIVRKVTRNGKVEWEFKSPTPRRIISREAALGTMKILELAVREGTGEDAYAPGYELAGKTGTAQKFDRTLKRYSKDKHLASFMALFPAEDPMLSILVMVDEPAGAGWGGKVAAPMAKDIAIETARILDIPSSLDTRYVVNWTDLEEKYFKDEKEKGTDKPRGLVEKFLAADFSGMLEG
ncbi:MAG: penicillin-binding protein 2 [Nitrospinota bacterium]|nr:penicillin-binding protein 2 [Nitrospinota bacterium]